MTETTYCRGKVYLPKEVRAKLNLVDGDVLHIEVLRRGVAKLTVVRSRQACDKALEKLEKPPNLGKLKGKLSRAEIYEDIT